MEFIRTTIDKLNAVDLSELNTLEMAAKMKRVHIVSRQLITEKVSKEYWKRLESAFAGCDTSGAFEKLAHLRRRGAFRLEEQSSYLSQIYQSVLDVLLSESAYSEMLANRLLEEGVVRIINAELQTEEFIEAQHTAVDKSPVARAVFYCLGILSNISHWKNLKAQIQYKMEEAQIIININRSGKSRYIV